jgi:PadR family transcriptional regulator PadR
MSIVARKRTNPEFLNGVPELLVLTLLSRRPMHGYDLVQAIRAETAGALTFGEGCIYPMLHQLEAKGYLASEEQQVRARARLVYSVTERGLRRLQESATRWCQVTQAVRSILGTDHGKPVVA